MQDQEVVTPFGKAAGVLVHHLESTHRGVTAPGKREDDSH